MFLVMLFGHIVGALLLFAAFAIEWVIRRGLRRSATRGEAMPWLEFASVLPRFHGPAGLTLVLTGGYMATTMDAWSSGWPTVSLATLVILAVLGMMSGARMRAPGRSSATGANASEPFRRGVGDFWLSASFRIRVAAALGIVYVMVAKPDFVPSAIIVTAFALAGAASTFRMWLATRSEAGVPGAARETGAFAGAKRQGA